MYLPNVFWTCKNNMYARYAIVLMFLSRMMHFSPTLRLFHHTRMCGSPGPASYPPGDFSPGPCQGLPFGVKGHWLFFCWKTRCSESRISRDQWFGETHLYLYRTCLICIKRIQLSTWGETTFFNCCILSADHSRICLESWLVTSWGCTFFHIHGNILITYIYLANGLIFMVE